MTLNRWTKPDADELDFDINNGDSSLMLDAIRDDPEADTLSLLSEEKGFKLVGKKHNIFVKQHFIKGERGRSRLESGNQHKMSEPSKTILFQDAQKIVRKRKKSKMNRNNSALDTDLTR